MIIGRRIGTASLAVAAFGLVWMLLLITTGGFDTEILGVRVRSRDPFRPLLIAAIGLTVYVASAGSAAYRRWVDVALRQDERLAVAAFAAITLGLGVAYNTTVAGGADAYGYVSQADRWLRGSLKVEQPWAAELPWPSRRWSAAPLGYRPIDDEAVWELVPIYSPGLPLMMAAAKIVGGHAAVFWVVPLCGALLVLATYGVGRRLGAPRAGLVGSWLVATNPTFLFMLFQPMSDVPVSAAWTVAFYFLFGNTLWTAAGAGLAAAFAIAIRPNLVWAAGVLGLWFVVRLWRGESSRWRVLAHGAAYALVASLGILTVALVNRHLFGSPFESGYGSLRDNFYLSRVGVNFRNYFGWLIETQTPIVLAGAAAICLPIARLWPGARDRRMFGPIVLFVGGLWLMYCSYLVFDVWWFLRFLLPSSPFLMIGVGAVAIALMRSRTPGIMLAIGGLVVALGVFQFKVGVDRGAFRTWRGERRYVSAAKLVRTATAENSVVLSMQYSGSLRYYAGRMTLRYDILDADWLDRAVEWLSAKGVHSYLLLDEWEIPEFERRFAGSATAARIRGNPLFIYKGPGAVFLFDLTRTTREPAQVFLEDVEGTRSVPPAADPTVVFK